MYRPRPLSQYPPGTLDALRSIVVALLRYQDLLPTDLYVRLDLFRGDIVRHEAPSDRAEVKGLRRLAVAAAGLKLRAA